jgi:iron complex transport system permease protein
MKELENKVYKRRFVVLIIIFVIIFLGSAVVGRYSMSVHDYVLVLISKLPFVNVEQCWDPSVENVLFLIRFPRICCAVLIGSSLALAGVCYQGLFRNPMVSPDILGASTGAGFGAALAILFGAGYFMITTSAFFMGLLAVFSAYVVSRFSKTDETLALILGGIVVSSLFSAGTSFVKLVADTDEQLPEITYWLMGMLTSIKVEDLKFVIIPITVGSLILIFVRWRLNLLTVEEDTAKSVGINITALRLVVIVCATLLTAASVSVSGMIGWVGLVIPHFCRILFGYDYRRLVPATMLMGGAFLLFVDDLARYITTAELPLGILTSFVGAPLFIYLILTGGGKKNA